MKSERVFTSPTDLVEARFLPDGSYSAGHIDIPRQVLSRKLATMRRFLRPRTQTGPNCLSKTAWKVQPARSECRRGSCAPKRGLAADFGFHFDFAEGQIIKISPNYQNPIGASNYQNIGCIDADFCDQGAIFQHFSKSTRIFCRKRVKISEIIKNLRTKICKIWKI
jgi:hypothetical protein